MKKILVIITSILITTSLYASVRLSYLQGKASVLHGQKWTAAKVGMNLSEKDKIKTLDDGKAVLVIDNTTRIWVRHSTEMEITSNRDGSVFNLLAGKIRAKVKLLQGRKFQVKTPVAVASVRGTEFIISWDSVLAVLEGKVNFSDLGLLQNIEVAQGQVSRNDPAGKLTEPREMTPQEKSEQEQEWQVFDNIQESKADNADQEKEAKKEEQKNEIEKLRMELHEAVADIRTDIEVAREITNEIKESDLSTGRTLRDVHGNLVRVEQHLLRPDNNTIQILNLTKRSDYVYSDRQKWGFAVPNTSRLDIMDVKIRMNMALPEQITEWPGYISSKGDDLHPESINVSITNQSDELKMTGDWMPKGTTKENGDVLNEDSMVMNSYINGWKIDTSYDAQKDVNALYHDGSNADGNEKDELWAWGISPQLKLTKDGQTNYARMYTEAYGINNSGGILNLKDFVSTSDNPFTFFKQVAAEQITFCRKLDGSDFLNKGNLDLVVTTDLAISVAEKLATQVGELNKAGTSDSDVSGNTIK